jgi:hypothetical protein
MTKCTAKKRKNPSQAKTALPLESEETEKGQNPCSKTKGANPHQERDSAKPLESNGEIPNQASL